jgi:archaellum biogenesis protein FlaJ (TadC family)
MTGSPPGSPKHSYRRPARNSKFLMAIIVVAVIVVSLQYTEYALFSSEQTSTLWGMVTGLIIGGFIFGWLKPPWKE